MAEKPLHFLVVDDDDESRSTVAEFLKSMGYERVSQAKDGMDAIRILDRDPSINFIVSDWDMPMMNGLNLLQRIRSNPTRAHLPFLIMTSPVSQEAEKIILAAESYVDSYIIKPFRIQLFQEKIQRMISSTLHGQKKQAVVVDDDRDALEMVVEYLNNLGFKDVKTFEDGKAALDYLNSNHSKVGLVVSDWEMPEMSGLELLKTCKTQAHLSEIPFLMITSQSSMERMKVMQAARANVDQYLLKPFTLDEVKKRIGTLLERARSRKEVQNFIVEASTHMEHGRYQMAIDFYEQAMKLDPNSDVVLRGLGDALSKAKGQEAALPYYKRAVEANPISVKGYTKLAAVYEHIGLLDKAIALLQGALKQISFSPELHFQLGKIYNRKGMLSEAQTEFEKTLEIQLDHQEARLMLGMLGVGRKKRDEDQSG